MDDKKTEKVLVGVRIGTKVEEGDPKMSYRQSIKAFGSLGKEVKISPKAHVVLNKAGYNVKYYVDSVSVTIGIGNDHSARLVMSVDAWNALNDGEKINVTTVKEFERDFR